MTFQTPSKAKSRFFDTPSAREIATMSREDKIKLLNKLNGASEIKLNGSTFLTPGKGNLRSARP